MRVRRLTDRGDEGRDSRALPAIGMTSLGFAAFSVSDAGVKLMLEHGHGTFNVMFYSGLVGFVLMVSWVLCRQGVSGFRSGCYRLHALRGVISICVFALVMYALKSIQLDEFYALIFLAPFFVALLGALLLGDEVGPHRMGAILIGFAAVLYMLRPDAGIDGMGAAAVILAAILFGTSMIIVRLMPAGENRALFPVPSTLCGLLTGLALADGLLVLPPVQDLAMLVGIGVMGACGSLCTATGFAMARSSATVAPFHYTQMLWGVLLGYLVFGDIPNPAVIGGATVLIATGIYLLRFEARDSRRKAEEVPVPVLRRSK